MAIKKSELYSNLWKACDELRGKMDASQYKDYILTLLFVKYISDKYSGEKYSKVKIPEGASFKDMIKLKGKADIGDAINKKIIAPIAEENDLGGLKSSVDFNDETKLGKGKEMVDRLSKLIAIFEDPKLDFSNNKAEGDDLLGDAYEFLMRHFATESGKSKGQFYTPSEVSTVMAKLIDIKNAKNQETTLYDPTCGSGSLLLKAAAETKSGVTIYGQENDNTTTTLAKMNMFIHDNPEAEIVNENTLSTPMFKVGDKLKTFDYLVANPPFSSKSWMTGFDPENDEYGRFDIKDWGAIPPKKNGDYAFLLHMIKSLKPNTGKAAVILPHGVLFRGNSEAEIRKNLIKKGYIKGIVGLPPNLFYGTGIPACLILIDKENAESRKGIFMIDASKGFYKDGNKNRLRSRDIHKIVDVFNKQLEIPKYSKMIPLSEISSEKNDYNLNIPRYIDSQEEEDIQDIEAHLKGDIPKRDIENLKEYWDFYPSLNKQLFEKSKREGYFSLKIIPEEINKIVSENEDFKKHSIKIKNIFQDWKNNNSKKLENLKEGFNPKELIAELSENILEYFSKAGIIDKYSVYQNLMSYWAEIMQDDAYIISLGGWKAEVYRVLVENQKKKMVDKGWACDLIPKELVINKYFMKEKEEIENLKEKLESFDNEMISLEEENGGDEDIFSEVRGDNGKISKGNINKRIKEIKGDSEFSDEWKIISEYLELYDKSANLKKEIKSEESKLDEKLLKKYTQLTEKEIKEIVIHDKWLHYLENTVKNEINNISQALSERIKELAERYETPLPEISESVEKLTKIVNQHLEKMGFKF